MACVTFNKNYIILKADAAVTTVDLGFADANALKNNQAAPKPLTGSSEKAVVHYKGEDPPPRTFRVAKEATFPEDAHVTITGTFSLLTTQLSSSKN